MSRPVSNIARINKEQQKCRQNNITDPITDQEIAFAYLILVGTMTDRRAAEAVGLNPDTAAYIKSKPCVHAYMLEHRATVQQHCVRTGCRRTPPLQPRPQANESWPAYGKSQTWVPK